MNKEEFDKLNEQIKCMSFDLITNYKKIPNILIANKSDLENEISEDYLLQLSKSINSETYFITSAKEGENIEKSFIFLAETIIHQNNKG